MMVPFIEMESFRLNGALFVLFRERNFLNLVFFRCNSQIYLFNFI